MMLRPPPPCLIHSTFWLDRKSEIGFSNLSRLSLRTPELVDSPTLLDAFDIEEDAE